MDAEASLQGSIYSVLNTGISIYGLADSKKVF